MTGVIDAASRTGLPRLGASSWRAAEASLPGKAGVLMGKLRRRTDQVVLAETTVGGRVRGFTNALKPKPK